VRRVRRQYDVTSGRAEEDRPTAVHIRRELIDLARHYENKRWLPRDSPDSASDPCDDPTALSTSNDKLGMWAAFYETVENLPVEEWEMVGLVFYHGWTQQGIADLFQVNEKTIQRLWKSACEKLRETLDEPPG
jgi:RNA polymerase sigma factor (sigma-70 family)